MPNLKQNKSTNESSIATVKEEVMNSSKLLDKLHFKFHSKFCLVRLL